MKIDNANTVYMNNIESKSVSSVCKSGVYKLKVVDQINE